MSIIKNMRVTVPLAVVATLLPALAATAQSPQDDFYKAYYLQHTKGDRDLKTALALYKSVAANRQASGELRAKAERHARDLAEELASGDFARLVPADTIFYLELNRPGEQARNLLGQLGLLRDAGQIDGEPTLGISPRLIDSLLGLRGVALAVTAIEPRRGPTNGVLILHPGDLDVALGLLETVLPAAGQPAEPIGGHRTYSLEGHAFVTRTSRLLVVSPDREQIRGVVERLRGRGGPSLAENDELSGAMETRGNDLVFCCMQFRPLLPVIRKMAQAAARRHPEVQAALAFLDIESTRYVLGRAGVGKDSISFDARLVLDEGHRNLAFNLLRQPGIPKSALSMVPEGTACFVAGAVNRRGAIPPSEIDARGRPVVTLMDFGRELFMNLTDFSVYVMPQVARMPWGPMPDVAVALHVNDPVRSRALWQLVFGTAQVGTGGGESAPRERRVGDASVESYQIEKVPVFLATSGNDLIFSLSERAIETSLEARSKGRTVFEDPVYRLVLSKLREDDVRVAAMSVGRVCEIASRFMGEREQREMAPFARMMQDSSVGLNIHHGANELGVSGRFCGVPNIAPMVDRLIKQETRRGHRLSVDDSLRGRFESLHARGRHDAARAVAVQIHQVSKNEPNALNSFAWQLLTESRYKNRYDDLALAISKTSNEASAWSNWFYVDTYARALFQNGKVENALNYQRKAVEMAGEHPRAGEAKRQLDEFLEASRKRSGQPDRRIR